MMELGASMWAGQRMLERWQPGMGDRLRILAIGIAMLFPIWFWPAYLSQLQGWRVSADTVFGNDFVNFWAAARLAAENRAATVMDPVAFPREQLRLLGEQFIAYAFIYPPHILLLLRPLGLLEFGVGWWAWSAVGFGGFALAAAAAARRFGAAFTRWSLVGLLFAPAVTLTMTTGQTGFFTSAFILGGVVNLQRRPIVAGIFFGLLTVKPHLGILVPFLLLSSRAWSAIASAVVTTTLLIAASVLIDGVASWQAFFELSTGNQMNVLLHGHENMYRQMPSVFGMAHRLGFSLEVGVIGQVAVSLIAAVAVIRGMSRTSDPLDRFVLLALGNFLVVPYALAYEMPVLVIATLLYVTRWRNDLSAREHWIWFGVWYLPMLLVWLGNFGAVITPAILIAALVVLLRRVNLVASTGVPQPAPQLTSIPIAP
jgi:hypothetical protein